MTQPIYKMETSELIKEFDLKKFIIDTHYDINDEYQNVDDLYNGDIAEVLADKLADIDGFASPVGLYGIVAHEVIDVLAEELVEEIYENDKNEAEYVSERAEAQKGEF